MAVALSSSGGAIKVKEESGGGSGSAADAIALFISKVWNIVNDKSFGHLVTWSESGKTFIVLDESRFAKEILPNYFKHNNFNSFVRQLNLYGFRKVAKPDQGSLVKTKNDSVEFWHANFRRDHPELLYLVQRRPVATRTGSEEKNPFISQVITDLHSMKGKQFTIETMLNELKRENSHLKEEIGILKEKNKHQHNLLNKIIHFIVHLLYKGTLPTKRRRLMLTTGDDDIMLGHASPAKRILLDSPSTPPYSVQSPPPPLPISPPVSTSATVSIPQHSNNELLPLSDDPASLLSGDLPGDEFLAELFKTSPPQDRTASDLTVPVSQSQSDTLSMVPYVEPPPAAQNQSSLTLASSHLDTQLQGINSLHEVLPDQLSIDPLILSEFINSSDIILPDYDVVDTARLLECISSDPQSDVPHEETVQNAIVPFSSANPLLDVFYNSQSQ